MAEISTAAQVATDSPQHHNLKDDREESHARRPNLSSLQIPVRSLENTHSVFTRIDAPSPSSTRAGLPPRPNSARLMSSVKNLLPQKSYRGKNSSQDGEKTVLILPDTALSDKPSTSRSFSLNRVIFSSSTKSAHSVPVTPMAYEKPVEVAHSSGLPELHKSEVQQHMRRSLSVPTNVKARSLRRTDSAGGLIRVIPATPRPTVVDNASPDRAPEIEIVTEEPGEDIPEEEAVCRICFIELGEGGETLKMECSCKGELALAHKECAVKWFSIKGNKNCDICKEDVRNLPVTLLKLQKPATMVRRPPTVPQQREVVRYRVWQDVPVLVMVSMLAYFCFLEQLLVSDLGARALALALPFSVVLGFLSSVIASTMVSKSYIWAYASFQFAIVILFAHIFYAVLNVNALMSVLLSSFTGFGIAISTNSLLVEYLRWRTNRRLQSSQHQNTNANTQRQQRQEPPNQHHHQDHHQNQPNQQHHQHNHQHNHNRHDPQQHLQPVTENSSLEQNETSREQDSRTVDTQT